ncbi:MAG: DUF1573 domain-containing protein [Planctomycetota bacterium]
MKSSIRPALRAAALFAGSSLLVGGAFALPVLVQDAGDAAKTQEAKPQAEKKKPSVGRGRRSGKTSAPKPSSVPRSAPKPAPVKAPTKGLGKELSDDELKKLAASRAGKAAPGKNAVPAPPRNPNAKLDLEFGQDTHDFGSARQGDLLTHVFQMKSAGSEPLVITQASPTCGCTLGEVRITPEGMTTPELYTFGNPIDPGALVELEATLDTASKRNDTQVRIQVYSNDGKTPVQSLTLKARIQPFIVASPPYVQLGQIRQGEEKVAKVTFRTSGGERVVLAENPNRNISMPEGLAIDLVAINPDDEGKSNQWQATFSVGADAKEGPGGYLLRLNTDIPLPKNEKKEAQAKLAGKPIKPTFYSCDANVSYSVIGALAIQPLYLSMGLVRPGQPLVRSARLTSYEPGFDLSQVKATLTGQNGQDLQWADAFSVTVKPVSGSDAVDLEVRLDGLPETADGAFRGTIVVETGHPTKPTMDVRFSGVCRKVAGNVARPTATTPQDAKKAAQKAADKSKMDALKKAEAAKRDALKEAESAKKGGI